MTGEKPGAGEEALYWSADGPLGPDKFENDLDHISEEHLAKVYGKDFMREMDEYIDAIIAQIEADEAKRLGGG